MKSKTLFILCFFNLLFGSGCELLEEEPRHISFFTDIQIDSASTFSLFINDEYVDDIYQLSSETLCGDSLLVQIPIENKDDMHIAIEALDGNMIDLGFVNLYSAGQGLKIKPSTDSALFVTHDLDSACTLIRLRW